MENLKVDYKKIKSISFTAKNGICVEVALNGDNTLSVIHKTFGMCGIQADFNEKDLKEYIDFLQNFYSQMKNS